MNSPVRLTPLLPAPRLGPHCFLKYETLQATGSFKIRGAMEILKRLESSSTHVIAASAGNHGAGVALAGQSLGINVDIYVPKTTPKNKCERMLSFGATLHKVEGGYDDAEALAKQKANERGLPFISPYDDDWVIKGNGEKLGDEIFRQCPTVKTVVCPMGGGGMASGLGQSFVDRDVQVIGVSPEQNCAMATSFQVGAAQTSYRGNKTIAEGLEGSVSQKTYDLCRALNVKVSTVSEQAIEKALAFCFRQLAIIIEPSAAVVVAAYFDPLFFIDKNKDHVLILSGQNCDENLLQRLIY